MANGGVREKRRNLRQLNECHMKRTGTQNTHWRFQFSCFYDTLDILLIYLEFDPFGLFTFTMISDLQAILSFTDYTLKS